MAITTTTYQTELKSSFVRIDAEFFKPEHVAAYKNLDGIEGRYRLGQLCERVTQGSNPIFSESGFPCINGKNIYFGTMQEGEPNYVSENEYIRLSNYCLHQNDIVITLKHATKIGRAWIVEDESPPRIFSRNVGLIRLAKNSSIIPSVLLMYLWTKSGQLCIDRCATGGTSGQITLPVSELKRIPVPPFPKAAQVEIDILFQKSKKAAFDSEKSYSDAQHLLESELGIDKLKSKKPVGYTARFGELEKSRRADAEFFQPKYQSIIELIRERSNCTFGSLFNISRGICLNPTWYNENEGIPYIRIKELSLSQPLDPINSVKIPLQFASGKIPTAANGDYVLAVIGATIGKINLIDELMHGSFFSNNTACLSPRVPIRYPNAMELILRSPIVQHQVQQRMAKTAQEKISDSELKKILLPCLDSVLMNDLEKLCIDSKNNYFISKKLLDQAKTCVEQLIEEAAVERGNMKAGG